MVNVTLLKTTIPTTIPTTTPIPTETIIDYYNGGIAPPELSAFLFFVIVCTIFGIWFMWMIFERGES
jgi:hypothetical protein